MLDLMQRQFHATLPKGLVEATIHRLEITGKTVIDLGFGEGDLALISLAAGASCVYGVEFDESLRTPDDPRVTVLHADLRDALSLPTGCVVSAPPYDLFLRFLDLVESYPDVWTLCPPKHLPEASRRGFRNIGTVDGSAFSPPSSGLHHILVRGPFAKAIS